MGRVVRRYRSLFINIWLDRRILFELAYRIPWYSVNRFSGCEISHSDSGDTASHPGRFESSALKLLLCSYRNGKTQIGVLFAILLLWGDWSAARPGRNLPPGKTRYLFYRRLGGLEDSDWFKTKFKFLPAKQWCTTPLVYLLRGKRFFFSLSHAYRLWVTASLLFNAYRICFPG